MEPVLEVENLTKIFKEEGRPDLKAVDGVSFQLWPGETLWIVGESGSGKSTLARLIARLEEPGEGRIFLCGRDITKERGRGLRKAYEELQMVFQGPVSSFDPRRTLGDGIGESLKNRGMDSREVRKRTVGLLKLCGLPESYAERYPHQVSGGECQRAAIARALAIEPSVLICDEATSSLDVTVQKQIMELLAALRSKEKMACLFICHNLALVQSFCDRVLVMYEGRIVEEGTPDEVIRTPRSAYTRQLVEAVFEVPQMEEAEEMKKEPVQSR